MSSGKSGHVAHKQPGILIAFDNSSEALHPHTIASPSELRKLTPKPVCFLRVFSCLSQLKIKNGFRDGLESLPITMVGASVFRGNAGLLIQRKFSKAGKLAKNAGHKQRVILEVS